MLGRVFLLENLGVIMKKLRKLSKIIVLGLSLCLLASCTDKKGEKNDYIIGVVQIADHPSLDAARLGFLEELDQRGLSYKLIDHRAGGDIALIPQLACLPRSKIKSCKKCLGKTS